SNVTGQKNQIVGVGVSGSVYSYSSNSGFFVYPTGAPYPQTGGAILAVPALTYAGVTNATAQTTSINPFGGAFSFFVVVTPTGTLTSRYVINSDDAVQGAIWVNASGLWEVQYHDFTNAPVTSAVTAVAGTPVLLTMTMTYPAGNIALQLDGTTIATATGLTTGGGAGASRVNLMGYQSGHNLAGALGDVYLTTDCKTGSDLLNLNRYFGAKYGITVP